MKVKNKLIRIVALLLILITHQGFASQTSWCQQKLNDLKTYFIPQPAGYKRLKIVQVEEAVCSSGLEIFTWVELPHNLEPGKSYTIKKFLGNVYIKETPSKKTEENIQNEHNASLLEAQWWSTNTDMPSKTITRDLPYNKTYLTHGKTRQPNSKHTLLPLECYHRLRSWKPIPKLETPKSIAQQKKYGYGWTYEE